MHLKARARRAALMAHASGATALIECADKKHDICLVVAGGDERERSVIEHRPAAIRGWADSLRERFGGAPIAVCIELGMTPGRKNGPERTLNLNELLDRLA